MFHSFNLDYVLVSHYDFCTKEIDAADKGSAAEEEALDKLLQNFGTHYAKESMMGIGVDFETRYTEEETVQNNIRTR